MLGPTTMTPELRQFGDLRLADFERYPIWLHVRLNDTDEPWYDDADEETFRPWTGPLPVSVSTQLLVRADFILADGCHLDGFITPEYIPESARAGVPRTLFPHVFLSSDRPVGFWQGRQIDRTQHS